VNGEKLIVKLRCEQMILGSRELRAHHQRQRAARRQEEQRGTDEPQPHGLVVHAGEPAHQAAPAAPSLHEDGLLVVNAGHRNVTR
jgi:hypothetical protein